MYPGYFDRISRRRGLSNTEKGHEIVSTLKFVLILMSMPLAEGYSQQPWIPLEASSIVRLREVQRDS